MSVGSIVSPSPLAEDHPCTLLLDDGRQQRRVIIQKSPFSIGRRPGSDLVIAHPQVSRDHAVITSENGELWLTDGKSKHGTFVNKRRIERHRLEPNDCLEFGTQDTLQVIFNPTVDATPTRELLSQISGLATASDLEKLTLLLEAARKLNNTRILDDVLFTLLDLTLRLTGAERAYVFLRAKDGELKLAAGRDSRGQVLADDSTISRSILLQAANSGGEFLLGDTRNSEVEASNSIIAFDLRTVICIPMSKVRVKDREMDSTMLGAASPLALPPQLGVLYLDSRIASGNITAISHDVLRAIASEAAALVENAFLVQSEEAARLYEQELALAASIQQKLMPVSLPQLPYARVRGRSMACREVGGDFFDVLETPAGLALVVADIAGKGISAALLASTMQGMLYSQLTAGMPLAEIAAAVNRYLCHRRLEAKYATMVLALLSPNGALEWVNCGHTQPLWASEESVRPLVEANLPVGLFAESQYESFHCQLHKDDCLLLYTDGITEAANAREEFFGEERLGEALLRGESTLDEIFSQVKQFASGIAVNDDCTVLELRYQGPLEP